MMSKSSNKTCISKSNFTLRFNFQMIIIRIIILLNSASINIHSIPVKLQLKYLFSENKIVQFIEK